MSELQSSVITATQSRRVGFMHDESKWFVHNFKWSGFRSPIILPWIRDHSTGRFFLNANTVAFEKEEDYFMFKLGYRDFD
jgi:hypothetical protein